MLNVSGVPWDFITYQNCAVAEKRLGNTALRYSKSTKSNVPNEQNEQNVSKIHFHDDQHVI